MRISDWSSDVCSSDLKQIAGLTIVVPKGSSSARLGNFLHKEFLNDLVTLRLRPEQLRKKLRDALGEQEGDATFADLRTVRSEEHTSELQSLMRNSYAVFCLKKKKKATNAYSTRQKNHAET